MLTLAAVTWQVAGDFSLTIWFPITFFAIQYVSLLTGRILSRLSGQPKHSVWSDLEALVSGNLVLGSVVFLLVFFLHTSIVAAFTTVSAVSVGFYLYLASITPATKAPQKQKLWSALLTAGLIIAVMSLWSRTAIAPLHISDDEVVFRPWTDFFIHASHIILFSVGDLELGRYESLGEPVRFYHYGSYMVAALVYRFGDIPALAAATSLWGPLGATLAGIGTFLLGRFLWGTGGGLAALMMVVLIPDASYYWVQNNLFGFHWLLQASPGTYWGLAALSLGLTHLIRGVQQGSAKAILAGFGFTFILVFVRAQFFPLTVLVFATVTVAFYPGLSLRWRIVWAAGLIVTAAVSLLIIDRIIQNPTILGEPGGFDYIRVISTPTYVGNYLGFGDILQDESRGPIKILAGTFFVLVSMLGAFLFGYLLITFLLGLRRRLSIPADIIPWIYVAIYIPYFWLMPVNQRGNAFEMVHRPFLTLYFVFTVWSAGILFKLLERPVRAHWKPKAAYNWSLVLFAMLSWIPFKLGGELHDPFQILLNTRYPIGLYRAAAALKEHSNPGDVFLHSGLDPVNLVIAISERRSYISRPYRASIQGNPARREHYADNRAIADRLSQTTDLAEAATIAHDHGIKWYLLAPQDQAGWAEQATPVFNDNGYVLYDLASMSES